MTIYEALGIEKNLLDIDIPKKIILDNLQSSQQLQKAQNYFKVIDKVILRASLQRSNYELQVIEISLTKPKFIQEISLLIQTAIKYHIIFVFTYNDMALIMQRSFQMTNSTDHIYSYSVSLTTEWIYFENLSNEVYFGFEPLQNVSDDDPYLNENENLNGIDNTSFKNIFSDIFKSITALNAYITDNTLISLRQFCDWYVGHSINNSIKIEEILKAIKRKEGFIKIGNLIFIDKLQTINLFMDNFHATVGCETCLFILYNK